MFLYLCGVNPVQGFVALTLNVSQWPTWGEEYLGQLWWSWVSPFFPVLLLSSPTVYSGRWLHVGSWFLVGYGGMGCSGSLAVLVLWEEALLWCWGGCHNYARVALVHQTPGLLVGDSGWPITMRCTDSCSGDPFQVECFACPPWGSGAGVL